MPNTFGHIALQAPVTKALFRDADPRWIYLGCIIPDLPWVLQRAVGTLFFESIDPYDLRLYCVVLATLFGSIVLSAAFAALAPAPRRALAMLAFGASIHLLLDATQIKWGNGVHLAAPLSWTMTRFDLYWPESLPTLLLTFTGVVTFVLFTTRVRAVSPLVRTGRRVTAATLLLIAYLSLPLAFADDAERADNHFVMTLRNEPFRTGSPVEFDRARWLVNERGGVLRNFTGEEFFLAGPRPEAPGLVSIRGDFVDERTIRVRDLHVHAGRARDWMSIVGLGAVAFAWIWPAIRRRAEGVSE